MCEDGLGRIALGDDVRRRALTTAFGRDDAVSDHGPVEHYDRAPGQTLSPILTMPPQRSWPPSVPIVRPWPARQDLAQPWCAGRGKRACRRFWSPVPRGLPAGRSHAGWPRTTPRFGCWPGTGRSPRRWRTLASRSCRAILRDPTALRKALQGLDTAYHIAAVYRRQAVEPQVFKDVNSTAVHHLLDTAIAAGVSRFVHCSTVGVHRLLHQEPRFRHLQGPSRARLRTAGVDPRGGRPHRGLVCGAGAALSRSGQGLSSSTGAAYPDRGRRDHHARHR
jgi:NAD dependent epimerase/dehydratase family